MRTQSSARVRLWFATFPMEWSPWEFQLVSIVTSILVKPTPRPRVSAFVIYALLISWHNCRVTTLSVRLSSNLAIDGGPKVRTTPFAPWPSFAEDEVEAAAAVLRSGNVNYWTGEEGHQFEAELAAFTGCKHAIALANGTVALELALYALGIGPGDEVVTTSRTFIASASCAVMRGAVPIMADVDRDSQNITAETIRAALTPRTRAIIAVHLAGWPCDMDPILELAQATRPEGHRGLRPGARRKLQRPARRFDG